MLSAILLVCAQCSARVDKHITAGVLDVGSPKTVFVGTTRVLGQDGRFTFDRSPQLQFLRTIVSIPPNRSVGSISKARGIPDPATHFAMAEKHIYSSASSFAQDLSRSIANTAATEREVTVYVHGFNNTFSDAAFRIAQLGHDLEVPGALVTYSWPSRASALGYEYDRDSALYARDGLEQLLRTIRSAGRPKMVLVAHSMGGVLLMEALRQIEIADPGWAKRNVQGVILLAPDLDPEVFRKQLQTFHAVPEPFVVVVSQRDNILRLSARIRGEQDRLGNLSDTSTVSDLPISIIDVSAFTDRSTGNHFVTGNSPALLQILRNSSNLDRQFVVGRQSGAQTLILRPAAEAR